VTYKALLWDMDGLLVDSEPLWSIAEVELAQRHDRVWTDEIKSLCMGHRIDTAVPIILTALSLPLELQLEAETFLLRRMVELFATGTPWMPGALELLADPGVPCALVSSSYRVLVDAVLGAVPPGTFATTLAGDEVVHAKPHGEPYETAARALGLPTAECLVLEDSLTGALSGLAAGCQVVVVPGEHTPKHLPAEVKILPSLADLLT
jgi:HAD superfamily hydrolase (TIGR01509 family)